MFVELVVIKTRTIQTPENEVSFVIESLSPDTKYTVAVAAVYDHGIGAWSNKVYGETSKSIKARIEPTDCPGKNNTTKEGKIRRCVTLRAE